MTKLLWCQTYFEHHYNSLSYVLCLSAKQECCQQFALTEAIQPEGTRQWSCLKLQQESASWHGKISYSKGPELLKIYKNKKSHEIQETFWAMCKMFSECSHSTSIITYSWILHWNTLKRDTSEITIKLAVRKTEKCSFRGTNVHARRKQTLLKQSWTFGQLQSMEFYALTIKITCCKYLSL